MSRSIPGSSHDSGRVESRPVPNGTPVIHTHLILLQIAIRMIANLAFDPSLPAMVYIEKRTVRTTLKVGVHSFRCISPYITKAPSKILWAVMVPSPLSSKSCRTTQSSVSMTFLTFEPQFILPSNSLISAASFHHKEIK